VLGFLQRCENETFDNVLADLRGDLFSGGAHLGGDLRSPSLWINSLFKSDSSYIVQISKNIGPLLNCMCDDKKMLFFKSKKHWMESLRSFAQLICYLMNEGISIESEGSLKREAVTVLIGHEGLVRAIVQWASFWYTESCPHLFDEIGVDDYTLIQRCGRLSTQLLLKDESSLRKTIGAMQVSLPENDIVSFVVGLIRRLKIERETEYLSTLHYLIVDGDCVDKSVIVGMVDFGVSLAECEEAITSLVFFPMVFSMLFQGSEVSKRYPSDTRFAFAIRAGLIQMCLRFIERFGDHTTSQGDTRSTLFRNIEGIFKSIHDVALHKKTWKAIRHERQDIEEKLEHLDTIIIDDVKCKTWLDKIKSILDMNGAYCCRCNKPLGSKERFQCGGCNMMTYCSRSCQRDDWLNGHRYACCNKDTVTPGQFQGRVLPITIPDNERAAAKMEELEVNNNMIQLKLFLDHSTTILEQAKSLNIPLCDCVVKFDLCDYPPKVTTYHYSMVYIEPEKKQYEASRSTKNITCMFYSYNFTGDVTNHSGEPTTKLGMQRLFPFEWLTQNK